MRLIDADALIADLENDVAIDQDTLDYEDLTEINRINIQFDKDCKQNTIDLLKNAPTIEPERKKGEWINKPDIYLDEQTWECSECGEPWIFIDGTPSENNANFCPNCGAEMKGEEHEAD